MLRNDLNALVKLIYVIELKNFKYISNAEEIFHFAGRQARFKTGMANPRPTLGIFEARKIYHTFAKKNSFVYQ